MENVNQTVKWEIVLFIPKNGIYLQFFASEVNCQIVTRFIMEGIKKLKIFDFRVSGVIKIFDYHYFHAQTKKRGLKPGILRLEEINS